MNKLLQLFWTNFTISACTFGGGYVIAGFMKDKFVDQLHWIDDEEMLDMIAMAQAAPGAIAVNTSVMVGWKIAGFPGMLVSVLGTILPPMLILAIISMFYKTFIANRYVALILRGMQAAVVAVIISAVADMVIPHRKDWMYLILAVLAAILSLAGVNVMLIIGAAILLGLMIAWRNIHAG